MQQTVRRSPLTSTLLVVSAAALLSGCAVTNDMMATIALPTSETAQAGADARAGVRPPVLTVPPPAGAQSKSLIVTERQRGYLDALRAAGVQPSNDLLALSIGSYVCQARAAKQSEAAVRDFVLPLVRSDVRKPGSSTAPAAEVDARTADYIRIATERLC